jgi:hypothetical protein
MKRKMYPEVNEGDLYRFWTASMTWIGTEWNKTRKDTHTSIHRTLQIKLGVGKWQWRIKEQKIRMGTKPNYGTNFVCVCVCIREKSFTPAYRWAAPANRRLVKPPPPSRAWVGRLPPNVKFSPFHHVPTYFLLPKDASKSPSFRGYNIKGLVYLLW